MKTKIIIGSVIAIAVIAIAVGFMGGDETVPKNMQSVINSADAKEVTLYKSSTCGCCTNYVAYLKKNGFSVDVVDTEDMNQVKEEHNVPGHLYSCHTVVMGPYVIEGHIPLEAVASLLEKQPEIKGIALPGMPSGSPGMPGPKFGPFEITSFGESGVIGEFIKL